MIATPHERCPTFGSLFTGIGGFDLGLERAGWGCRWQVESDPFCQRVLARHWPEVARYGDIHALDPERRERVDLVCGGFPCQPVSVAGKRRAQADERWLWPEFARVVRGVRPQLVLVENVPGLLVRGFGDVLGDLAESGYDAEWDCLPASAFGAPHRRDRVWLVAYATGARLEGRQQPSAARTSQRVASRGGEQIPDPAFVLRGAIIGNEQDGVLSPMGYPDDQRQLQPSGIFAELWGRLGDTGWWRTEPDVGRVAHGVPARVDRLRSLGNAIVPQIAEWIGVRLLLALDNSPHE